VSGSSRDTRRAITIEPEAIAGAGTRFVFLLAFENPGR
jgi:hypothetical protein